MKKITLNAIADVLSAIEFENKEGIMTEIAMELNRDAEEKANRAAEYESVREIVFDVLSDTPVTIAELFENVRESLPSGFTKGKLQYAVTRLWKDAIVRHDGSPATYTRA